MPAWQALRDSGLDLDRVNRDEIGVFIGSGIGGLQTVSEQCQVLLERGPDRLSAFMIPMLISNMASGLFSMYHKLRGPNFATCSACATSNHALGEAWRTIKMGDAQVMFAGGAEATIVPIGIGGFCAMRALSTRNDDPQHASRPFDKERDGFVMGEGAGVLVLEELEHAKKARRENLLRDGRLRQHRRCQPRHRAVAGRRRRRPLHEDGPAPRRPQPRGHLLHQCPRHLHSPGGHCGDPGDQDRLRRARPQSWPSVPPKAPPATCWARPARSKWSSAAKAIETGIVPPTINYEVPDPECDLDYVPNTARQMKVEAVLNNSFGFGGHNASILAKKFVG